MNSRYLDWRKPLSYNALLTMIITARGYGKTYGLRKQCVKDYIKDGSRFVEIVRYKDELSTVCEGYFDKMEEKEEFPGHIFKTTKRNMFIAERPASEEEKPRWQVLGYFVPLSMWQDYKKKTYANVKRVLMDEAIIDRKLSPFKRYLPHEYDTFVNMLDTIFREGIGHAYLLGNACDLINPYFIAWGISTEPQEGYSWHQNRTCLLCYLKDEAYQERKRSGMIGRLLGDRAEASAIIDNEFKGSKSDFIAPKTSAARFQFGVVFQGDRFGIWLDSGEGYYYVNSKIPDNGTIYSLSASDNRINYVAVSTSSKRLKGISKLHYLGIIRYESAGIEQRFLKVLELFGVR